MAKVEGAYHGGYDYAEVSQTASPDTWGHEDKPNKVPVVHGTPESALSDVVIIPFNDTERAIRILDEHASEIAGVLLDLMPHRVGLNLANPEFVEAIRAWTTKHRALLILDEVITFRSRYGGIQTFFDVTPDLTALGKMIGGGFPVGAVAGRAEIMDVLNPRSKRFLFPHSGTFSANPISMVAGLTAMRKFDESQVERLNALTRRAIDGITGAIERTGARACVTGGGSILRVHMKAEPPHNFREAYTTDGEKKRLAALLDHLFESGYLMINTCSATLSTPMTEIEIDGLVEAMETGLANISAMP